MTHPLLFYTGAGTLNGLSRVAHHLFSTLGLFLLSDLQQVISLVLEFLPLQNGSDED